jgi:integrase
MTRKPFYRSSDCCWYVQDRIGSKRKQIKLIDQNGDPIRGRENKECAYRAFHKFMAQDPVLVPEPAALKVCHVCDLFLVHAEKHNEPKTFAWYKKYLQAFNDLFGTLGCLEVKPIHVTRWLEAHPKWTTSGRCAVIALKRAYNWCEEQGLIPSNPLKKVRKPPAVRRDRILTPAERQEIFDAIRDREFREFVLALQETGCRPGEVARVTAANVDLDNGVWIFNQHKTKKKTGKPRVIYLTPTMIDLTRRLMLEFPNGPLFRGPARCGRKAYTGNAIRCRFRRLRKKLPHLKGVIAYTFRHSYITDALERGVSVASVAELAGHTDLRMIQDHYGHLSEKKAHLQEAARKAVGYAEAPKARRKLA